MKGLEQCGKIEFLRHKTDTLAKLLARRQQQAKGPVAVPYLPPPSAADTFAVQNPRPSPLNTAAVAAVWPAQDYYRQVRSGTCPYPILPEALAKARAIKPKPGGPARTLSVFYWHSCFEEVVSANRPLSCAELNREFDKQRVAILGAETVGHRTWLRFHPELLLVLYKAAGVKVKTSQKQPMIVLETFWRKRGKELLWHLAEWFRQAHSHTVSAYGPMPHL